MKKIKSTIKIIIRKRISMDALQAQTDKA